MQTTLTNRRTVMLAAGAACAMICPTVARAQPKPLDEKDPQAAALGYVADGTKADKTKFPKYAAGQTCAGCALYQGKAADATAACPLFAGKTVVGKGWCSAWSKRA
jgi:High potential iron-sulfur protein